MLFRALQNAVQQWGTVDQGAQVPTDQPQVGADMGIIGTSLQHHSGRNIVELTSEHEIGERTYQTREREAWHTLSLRWMISSQTTGNFHYHKSITWLYSCYNHKVRAVYASLRWVFTIEHQEYHRKSHLVSARKVCKGHQSLYSFNLIHLLSFYVLTPSCVSVNQPVLK